MRGAPATPTDRRGEPATVVGVSLEPAGADDAPLPATVLARIPFRAAPVATGVPWQVPLALAAGAPVDEVWRTSRPVAAGRRGALAWRGNDDVVFGAIRLADDDIEAATIAAYAAIQGGLDDLGGYRIVRLWNYFPRIHEVGAGSDRYGLFCRGRHRVLTLGLAEFECSLPAASAIGSDRPGLVVHVLATRDGGRQVENPRQMSAFHYPPAYAPRSPSFSRSVLTRGGDGCVRLYVSGTASIVGHRTRHPGDLPAQLDETLANLAALLAAAATEAGVPLAFRVLRTYLRGDVDPAPVAHAVAAALGGCPQVVLRGDICRADLVVEIEGVAEPATAAADRGTA